MSYNGYTNWETWTIVAEYFTDMSLDGFQDYDLIGESHQETTKNVEVFVKNWEYEREFIVGSRHNDDFLEKVDFDDIADTVETMNEEFLEFERENA